MSIKSALKRLFSNELHDMRESKDKNFPAITPRPFTLSNKGHPDMVHGTVSVSDGKVVVTDPKNDGSYPTIVVPDNPMIQVFVNGEQVQGEVVLSQSHDVDIKFSSVEPSISPEVIVSDDQLSVTVKVNLVKGVKFSLKEIMPSRHLKLVIEESCTYPSTITPEAVLSLLNNKGYNGRIDYTAVNRLCNASETQEAVVLRGTPPQQGQPANIRMSASVHAESDEVFRTTRCPKVSIGTTCAVVEPEKKGLPGTNVYGVPISPPKPDKKLPNFADGVINVNGNIVAIREGRLIYKKNLIDVVPEMVYEADVSAANGEIQFNGNIVVHGSIQNQATVKATGMIVVYGDIESSSVFGGQGVFVRNGIYGSNVVSGHLQIVYENLSGLLNEIIPQLKRFGDEYSQMITYAIKRFDAHIKIPKIPSILIENRHQKLVRMLKLFVDDYADELYKIDMLYQELKQLVDTKWFGQNSPTISQRDSELLHDKLSTYNNSIKSIPKQHVVVKATEIASSTVRSVGNILVKRTCYSSTLESGNIISVHKTLRGGFAVAKKAAYITELGDPSGIETSVRVNNPNGFIKVKLNHINTLLDLNGTRTRTFKTERDIRFGGMDSD